VKFEGELTDRIRELEGEVQRLTAQRDALADQLAENARLALSESADMGGVARAALKRRELKTP
jgi:hypothetical protein